MMSPKTFYFNLISTILFGVLFYLIFQDKIITEIQEIIKSIISFTGTVTGVGVAVIIFGLSGIDNKGVIGGRHERIVLASTLLVIFSIATFLVSLISLSIDKLSILSLSFAASLCFYALIIMITISYQLLKQ